MRNLLNNIVGKKYVNNSSNFNFIYLIFYINHTKKNAITDSHLHTETELL